MSKVRYNLVLQKDKTLTCKVSTSWLFTMKTSYYKKSSIYEINLRQYSYKGDIQSFLPHLYRLNEMGVKVIWLMPIHPIGVTNRKGSMGSPYSCQDYYQINPDLGTKDDFKYLVEIVHSLGMKIILDWVSNHTSWDHVWTQTHPEYYILDEVGRFISPYDWSDVIQLNHQNEEMQLAMMDAMKFWVTEFDIDGFRADMAHLSPLDFWKKSRYEMESVKSDLIWLGETEDVNYYEAFDIIYAWDWMHYSRAFIDEKISIQEFIRFLKSMSTFPRLYFTSNHDENSWNGTEYEKYGIYAKALSVFTFFYPHAIPLIYSGQEIPNLKRLSFFEKDDMDWSNGVHLFSFYKILIEERNQSFNDYEIEFIPSEKKMIAFRLSNAIDLYFIFLSFDNQYFSFQYLLSTNDNGMYKNIFSERRDEHNAQISIEMNPGDYIVLKRVK